MYGKKQNIVNDYWKNKMELKEEDKKRMLDLVTKYANIMREDKTRPMTDILTDFFKECEFLNSYTHEGFPGMAVDPKRKLKGIDPETFEPIYED